MSSLFGLLNLGASALQAQNAGVAVTSNNVANASTPGYSRQRLDLESQIGMPLVGGVRAAGVDRLSDSLLAGRTRANTGSLNVADAFSSAMLDVEAGMIGPGDDLGTLVAGFFSGMSQVSSSPTDQNLRDGAVQSANELAAGIQRHSAELTAARGDANQRIREQLKEANRLIGEIAQANRAIVTGDDPVLRDRREQAADKLAGLVGGTARIDPDGQMRVTLSGGETLVDGAHAAQFVTTPDLTLGNMDRIEVVDGSHRRDVTSGLDGGRVAGDLRVRDHALPEALLRLDQLAFDISTSVNDVHRQNAGLDGDTDLNLFTPPHDDIIGSAAVMDVNPDILSDSAHLATAAVGAGPGDNQGARALLALRDQRLADGGQRTFVDAGIQIVADIGRSAADAAVDRDFFKAQGDHLAGLRDSVSGVSLEEEMSNLSQFQHAAEAQVKFLSTVDDLLGTIIQGL
ncbi:MAG TPA: flagellar hook-associated protein FlgK [Kofleriaceae bacterium]|nr:flagellar hook-associated protein FlgK [Kofleriaceae bacterium]